MMMMKSPGNADDAKEDDETLLSALVSSFVFVSSSRNTQQDAHLSRTPPPPVVPIPFLRKQRVDIVVVVVNISFVSNTRVSDEILIQNSEINTRKTLEFLSV